MPIALATTAYSEQSSSSYKEYEVKAAFLFNFLKFVDWPQDKLVNDANEIVIGIIGDDPFGQALDIFKGKTIDERRVAFKRFPGMDHIKKMGDKEKKEHLESVRKCHLLFISPSEQKVVNEIISLVENFAVLTVGDTDHFIESGGMINLFIEDNKIRFDINLSASKKAGLEMRSQLVRLARKVIKDQQNSAPSKNSSAKKEDS